MIVLSSAVFPVAQSMGQDVTVADRESLQQAVSRATPGTRILIRPGVYQGGLHFYELQGTATAPIVLIAQDPADPPVFQGGSSCIHLTDPRHVQLQHLTLTGARVNGLNIDDGSSADTPAAHVVLSNLTVRDIGPDGNRDGIKLSGLDHFTVKDCTLERWGSSGSAIDMVGCHQGRIVQCTFRHRSDIAANGVQTKGGSSEITIQHCRFENAGGRAVNIGGSTGLPYFRPQDAVYEARDITIMDCTFIGSMSPVVFVGVDGATVQFNTIYRPTRWVLRILQESQQPQFVACRNGRFTNNLIAFRTDEVRTVVNVGGGTAPDTFTFAANYWYAIDSPERSQRLSLPVRETDGHYGVNPQFVDEQRLDLRLKDTSVIQNAGVRPLSQQASE